MNLSDLALSSSPLDNLAAAAGRQWNHLRHARQAASDMSRELESRLKGLDNLDSSIVIFGSLARGEWTHGSDLDWTLLIDGKADPQHIKMAQKIGRLNGEVGPGREGTFGKLAFSREIVNFIGGEEDSNTNTTRRILLLLESKALGNPDAWQSVKRNVMRRYIEEDYGLWSSANPRGVPLFLLNDISRYWRTMVVDFAYKQRDRENAGYAIRSLKLGLSRKLIYASGIMACLLCEVDHPNKALFQDADLPYALNYLQELFELTPVDLLARALTPHEQLRKQALQLFDAYDRFLELMNNDLLKFDGKHWRQYISALELHKIETDPVFQQARQIRNSFGEALKDIFLRIESPIQKLMIERGIF